jgi:uncharacterized protein YeaO (DUF488 family)
MWKRVGWLMILGLWVVPVAPADYNDEPEDAEHVEEAADDDAAEAMAAEQADGEAEEAEVRSRDRSKRSRSKPAGKSKSGRILDMFRAEVLKSLDFDEESSEEFNAIIDEQIEDLNENVADDQASRKERAAEIRELISNLRDAQRDGDRERVAEMREQLTGLRKDTAEESLDFEALVDDLRDLIYEDQMEQFDHIVRKYAARLSPKKKAGDRLKTLRKALSFVELTPDQRKATRSLFAESMRSSRMARGDAAKMDQIAKDLQESILDELDEEQADVFTAKVTELERVDGQAGKGRTVAPKPVTPPAVRAEAEIDPEVEGIEVLPDDVDTNPYDDDPSPD